MTQASPRAAVLIIGSLWWDNGVRGPWRDKYLDNHKNTSRRVTVSIRYGRYSISKRRRHYTMTFAYSPLPLQDGQSIGLVAPCNSTSDLDTQIRELAVAEGIAADSDWGVVALLPNPCRLADLAGVLGAWRQKFNGNAGVNPRVPDLRDRFALTPDGLLDLAWPTEVGTKTPLDFDLLLATANAADLVKGGYATPERIAECFATGGEARTGDPRYFVENVRAGIRTAEDRTIWQKMIAKKPDWAQQHPDVMRLLAP